MSRSRHNKGDWEKHCLACIAGQPIFGQAHVVGLYRNGSSYREPSWNKAASCVTWPPLRDDSLAQQRLLEALNRYTKIQQFFISIQVAIIHSSLIGAVSIIGKLWPFVVFFNYRLKRHNEPNIIAERLPMHYWRHILIQNMSKQFFVINSHEISRSFVSVLAFHTTVLCC